MVKKSCVNNLTKQLSKSLKIKNGGVEKKNNSTRVVRGGAKTPKCGFKRPRFRSKVNGLTAMMKGCGVQNKKTPVCQKINHRSTLVQRIINNMIAQEKRRKANENSRKMRNMQRQFSALVTQSKRS